MSAAALRCVRVVSCLTAGRHSDSLGQLVRGRVRLFLIAHPVSTVSFRCSCAERPLECGFALDKSD